MNRRRALLFFGAAGAATAVAGCAAAADNGSSATTTTGADGAPVAAAPQETAGPYPGDGSNGPNVLVESGVVRSDITTSFGSYSGVAEGVPMTLRLKLQDLAKDGVPGANMAVYVWQCDRSGNYSLYSDDTLEQNYLRGVQVADEAGAVTFDSIFPACYPGRWPHIHFEVYDTLTTAVAGENARLTSQIALPKDVCDAVFAYDKGYSASIENIAQLSLDSDMVFGDGWDAELAKVSGNPAAGLTAELTIGVADKSQNVESDNGFGPPPGGAPGGPPPGLPPGASGPN